MTLLKAHNIVKKYGSTYALKGVDFEVYAGAVNVLIGENGAGKSTLMKILAGVEQPSSGDLIMDGQSVHLSSVRDATSKGISIVHQELNLCSNLSVTDNVFLSQAKGLFVNSESERKAVASLMERLEQDIHPDTLVGQLRIGQQQIVEIARALMENARILILDEPTSALSPTEIEVLFRLIGDLKASGTAIIYISHRLEELMQIGDYITILRDGDRVAHAPIADASMPWIVRNMLGREAQSFEKSEVVTNNEVVLAVKNVNVARPNGTMALKGINLEFHKGEVVSIYGLLGAGRSELLETILGARKPKQGDILLQGRNVSKLNISQRIEAGLSLVPEDRKSEGLFPNLSVGDNIGLSNISRYQYFGILDLRAFLQAIEAMIAKMGVKTSSASLAVTALSGGNQQKVVIGRCLLPGPLVLMIDEPGRGVDIGARSEIFRSLVQLAREGMCVIYATSDISETVHADRVIVLARGQIAADIAANEASEDALVGAANSLFEHA